MPTLWLKFPDEALFNIRFSETGKIALENVFSTSDPHSPWMQALEMLKLKKPVTEISLIKWHRDAPYFNWSCMAETISGGTLRAVSTEGGYSFAPRYKIRSLLSLIAGQWTMTRFLQTSPSRPASLAHSIALGLVMQSLVLRMGKGAENLAQWLAMPSSAPAGYRVILREIQSIQLRRTQMSHVWKNIFPAFGDDHEFDHEMPEFFWDDVPVSASATNENKIAGQWRGLSVCAGTITGLAIPVTKHPDPAALAALKKDYNAPLILVFRTAHPKTTESFEFADAVLFAHGGVLSHACTIAREMNLPSVTALGDDFYKEVSTGGRMWLTVDARAGIIVLAK